MASVWAACTGHANAEARAYGPFWYAIGLVIDSQLRNSGLHGPRKRLRTPARRAARRLLADQTRVPVARLGDPERSRRRTTHPPDPAAERARVEPRTRHQPDDRHPRVRRARRVRLGNCAARLRYNAAAAWSRIRREQTSRGTRRGRRRHQPDDRRTSGAGGHNGGHRTSDRPAARTAERARLPDERRAVAARGDRRVLRSSVTCQRY